MWNWNCKRAVNEGYGFNDWWRNLNDAVAKIIEFSILIAGVWTEILEANGWY